MTIQAGGYVCSEEYHALFMLCLMIFLISRIAKNFCLMISSTNLMYASFFVHVRFTEIDYTEACNS